MQRFLSCSLIALSALAAGSPAFAGTVSVTFVDTDHYADAGTEKWEEKGNLDALAGHLQRLGERMLPANQVLKVEVLDVDLAGTVLPRRRNGTPERKVRGMADFPKMHVRYTLESPGAAPRTGDEWVSDMNYTRGPSSPHQSQPLFYEKRMLDTWFKDRFAPQG